MADDPVFRCDQPENLQACFAVLVSKRLIISFKTALYNFRS